MSDEVALILASNRALREQVRAQREIIQRQDIELARLKGLLGDIAEKRKAWWEEPTESEMRAEEKAREWHEQRKAEQRRKADR